MRLPPIPTEPDASKFPQPPKPEEGSPKPNPEPSPIVPAPRSRVSPPRFRMADPAVGGSLVRAEDWTPRFGDMVWGKVKSHPWWPGHVYSLSLSDDQEVHRGHRQGLVLVAFFGDGSYGWFEPHELVRFADQFAEKISVGGNRPLAAAVAESVDEIARRSALALLCPCRGPDSFRRHNEDPRFLLVNVPGFDCNAEYLPEQVTAAQERFVPGKMVDFLQNAAVQQKDAAQTAARTLPGIEMAAMVIAYRRSRYEKYDITYAESFGVDPEKALEAEKKTEAERSQRARPLKGRQRVPLPEKETAPPARGRRGAAGAAARLMEKIVPGAPAMKPRASSSSKKDQYLLKRREDAARVAPPAALPDALEDGGPPPGFPPAAAEPQTPPLPGSGGAGDEEEFMLQKCALPPAGEGGSADAVPPKKAAKGKKARVKREREEPESSAPAAGEEPKKKKSKKKKLAELNGGIPTAGASSSGAKSAVALSSPPKVDLEGLDLKQVMSDLQKLPVLPFHGASGGSDASQSFVLAFRSKHYEKSYENDPPEESKKTSLDNAPAAAPADGQPPKPAKKKQPVMRPADPTMSGVKRGPSDRQEELASKKKIKLEKLKTLAADKKAGLEQKDAGAAAAATLGAQQQPRAGMKEKAAAMAAAAKKKTPAPARAARTASPTALMMKFPLKSTLPSVASLKARFARFGPLDIDGIRVYWKSHMCRVIYRFQSDAEVALKYAKANAMFGQLTPNYYLRPVESSSADLGPDAAAPPVPPPRSDLRLMETTPFRPGSSGNGAPLTLSRAAPARAAAGQQPKSILKKNNDDGLLAAAARDSPRVKFVLDAEDSRLEPPALPVIGGAGGSNCPDAAAASGSSKMARSVGFAQSPLLPPPRPAQPSNLQAPMHAQQLQQPLQLSRVPTAQQQLPPPPPLPYQPSPSYQPPRTNEPPQYLPPSRLNEPSPYAPRHMDVPSSFSAQPPYQLPRHSEGMLPLAQPGQPPLPYPPRAGFPGQQYRPNDMPPAHSVGHNAVATTAAGEDMPVWKRGPKEFDAELMRVMLGIAKLVEPLTDKNGNFPYHLFSRSG